MKLKFLAEYVSGVIFRLPVQKWTYNSRLLAKGKSGSFLEECGDPKKLSCKSRTCWSSYVIRKNKPKRSSVKWIVRQYSRARRFFFLLLQKLVQNRGEVTTGKASKLEIVSKPKWVGVSVLFRSSFVEPLLIYAFALVRRNSIRKAIRRKICRLS